MATPKQARLPGVEDPEIEELVETAEKYADVRDKRIALSAQEGAIKQELLALMHKNKKRHYQHAGVEIDVVAEDETVRVRIKKESDDED